MTGEEREVLSLLRCRETWSRWGQAVRLKSKEGRAVKEVIDRLHESQSRSVLPLAWIGRGIGEAVKLDDPLPARASIERLESILVTSSVYESLERILKKREQGEYLSLEDLRDLDTQKLLQHQVKRNGSDPYSMHSVDELVEGRAWETRGEIPTFLHPELDEYLGGGIGKGQLAVLQAPAKKGKTTFLLLVAFRAARRGLRTLFLSCENYKDQLGERLSQIREAERGKRLPSKHLFLQYHPRLSVRDVERYVQGRDCDMLIVDYEGKMSASIDFDWTWRTTEIYNGMRDLADRENLVLWTATQEHDSPGFKRESSRLGTFGSKTKIQLCDLFLGLYSEPRMNRATLTVLGRRGRGREGGSFRCRWNPDTAELTPEAHRGRL